MRSENLRSNSLVHFAADSRHSKRSIVRRQKVNGDADIEEETYISIQTHLLYILCDHLFFLELYFPPSLCSSACPRIRCSLSFRCFRSQSPSHCHLRPQSLRNAPQQRSQQRDASSHSTPCSLAIWRYSIHKIVTYRVAMNEKTFPDPMALCTLHIQ